MHTANKTIKFSITFSFLPKKNEIANLVSKESRCNMSDEKKSQRVKLELEYPIRSSLSILFQQISTPSGLQAWFADDVSVNGSIYSFAWNDGTSNKCELIRNVRNKYMRFKVIGDPKDEYWEMKIIPDELSGGQILIVTEFTTEEEADELADIWDAAVDALCNRIGA